LTRRAAPGDATADEFGFSATRADFYRPIRTELIRRPEIADERNVMDLVNAAVGMKQAEMQSQVQYAVAKKLMDTQKMEGAAVVKLIESASASVAKAGDELVAAATGLGGEIDVYA
jgi:hypothetical protein